KPVQVEGACPEAGSRQFALMGVALLFVVVAYRDDEDRLGPVHRFPHYLVTAGGHQPTAPRHPVPVCVVVDPAKRERGVERDGLAIWQPVGEAVQRYLGVAAMPGDDRVAKTGL